MPRKLFVLPLFALCVLLTPSTAPEVVAQTPPTPAPEKKAAGTEDRLAALETRLDRLERLLTKQAENRGTRVTNLAETGPAVLGTKPTTLPLRSPVVDPGPPGDQPQQPQPVAQQPVVYYVVQSQPTVGYSSYGDCGAAIGGRSARLGACGASVSYSAANACGAASYGAGACGGAEYGAGSCGAAGSSAGACGGGGDFSAGRRGGLFGGRFRR